MAKQQRTVEIEEEQTSEPRGEKPDWLVKVRQPPVRGSDGKFYQSKNFTPVGVAWNKRDKNGRTFIAAKLNIQDLTFADNSFILYPPYEE